MVYDAGDTLGRIYGRSLTKTSRRSLGSRWSILSCRVSSSSWMRSFKTALNSLVSLLGVLFSLPPNFLPVVLAGHTIPNYCGLRTVRDGDRGAFPSGGGQGEQIGHQSLFLQGIAESQEFIYVLEE